MQLSLTKSEMNRTRKKHTLPRRQECKLRHRIIIVESQARRSGLRMQNASGRERRAAGARVWQKHHLSLSLARSLARNVNKWKSTRRLKIKIARVCDKISRRRPGRALLDKSGSQEISRPQCGNMWRA
jgi:hypothetical protein